MRKVRVITQSKNGFNVYTIRGNNRRELQKKFKECRGQVLVILTEAVWKKGYETKKHWLSINRKLKNAKHNNNKKSEKKNKGLLP